MRVAAEMWESTGRIFQTVGLRWVPTGKIYASCTSKDDNKPIHGSNVDISRIHECKQTLDLSAGTSINVQKKQSIDLSAVDSQLMKKKYDDDNFIIKWKTSTLLNTLELKLSISKKHYSNTWMQKSKVDTGKALDVGLFVTESSGTESRKQDIGSRSGNDDNSMLSNLKSLMKEKVFAIATLKNELRKLKGNSMDTKFTKLSILGKPTLQPLRNQSVVRQSTAFKFEQPKFSKPRFASQVDVKNNLSKPVTPHYVPNVREFAFTKPHHVITSSESRNSSKNMPRFSSNDMVKNHYLEEARKKTQERNRNLKSSMMPSSRLQNTANGSKPKPRSPNQMTRNWPTSKSSCVPTGKIFTSCTSKDDNKPTHGSNVDISKSHKCKQTLDLSAVVSKSSTVTTGDASDKRQQQPD
ncbi:hypothetical protein Tco_0256547 [Tanacetum coccineum]